MRHLLGACCIPDTHTPADPRSLVLYAPHKRRQNTLRLMWRPQLALGACVWNPEALQGPTPLRQPGEGKQASLDLGMWAGQSGAGWPRVGCRQSWAAGQLADSWATQGRGLGSKLPSKMAVYPTHGLH